MSELIEWVCTRCHDRVCKCQVPPDTYPYQALVCVSFVPEWRVVGVVTLPFVEKRGINIDFIKELVRDALLTDGEYHKIWYLIKIAEEVGANTEDIEYRGIPP